MDWKLAACRHNTTINFYPDGAHAEAEHAKAKKLCDSCPIQSDCLDYAIASEPFGFWGGMNERQRRLEKKRRQRLRRLRSVPEQPVAVAS
jgi:WhiB family redox-sensing transcriptional regulator